MSRRLDLPLAVAAWVAGFAWVRWKGNWAPLAVLAVLGAARLLLADPETRALLAPRRAALRLAAASAAAMIAATYAGYALLARLVPSLPAATAALYRVLNAGGYGRAALGALVVVVSACEEVVWRGRALAPAVRSPGLRALDGRAAGRAAAVALIYGASHLASGSILLALVAVTCGLAWGLLRLLGCSLWASIMVHAAWDLAILVVWPLV